MSGINAICCMPIERVDQPGESQEATHSAVCVPIELQNMSFTVKGWIRVISSGDDSVATQPQPQFSVCAVRADVTSDCG